MILVSDRQKLSFFVMANRSNLNIDSIGNRKTSMETTKIDQKLGYKIHNMKVTKHKHEKKKKENKT